MEPPCASPAGVPLPGVPDAQSVLLVPFTGPAGVGGALLVAATTTREGNWPPEEDVEAMRGFAAQAALALDRAQAREDRAALAVFSDRDRIARDLHDLVIQRLFATGLSLQGAARLAGKADVEARIKASVDELDSTIRDIRGTIFALGQDPRSTDLRAQVREAVTASAATLGQSPHLVIEGPLDSAVPDEIRPHLIAVLVEALSNAARHAGAMRVDVRVAVDDRVVLVEVADDGRGFTATGRESGLANLRRRAQELDGSCDITSVPDGGTTVRWSVPVAPVGPGRKDAMSIRVFLLDDHEVVRRGLRDLLESADFEVVGEAGTVAQAVARIPALRPDVCVLDARLPDGSGIDVCRDVRSIDPTIRALILTSYDDDEALFAAIMAGAAGYVLKQVGGDDLIDAIRHVAAGRSLLDPAVTTRVLERMRTGASDQPEELATLTDQERKILALIAEGLTNRQIGERMFLAEKTVKNYVSSLLAKLGWSGAPGRRAGLQADALRTRTPVRTASLTDVAALISGRSCPRIVVSGNAAVPWPLLHAVDEAVPAYRLFMLNAPRGVPQREGVVFETPFVGPGMRGSSTLAYLPARLSQVPGLFATTCPPDVVLLHTSLPHRGRVSMGIEVNVLPRRSRPVAPAAGSSSRS
jgi:DNA-binding NarL/FixJ family response regulator